MNKEKLILLAVPPNDELLRTSRQYQYESESFVSRIENADNPRLHMFVASNRWDELIIQMKDTEALAGLKYLIPKFNKVTVFLFGEITVRMVQCLGELYPDKASTLRKAFMTGQDLGGILNG